MDQANVNAWASQINGDLSNLVSSQNGIQTSVNGLTTLVTGTDPLDIQSAQLSLQEAQQTYANYFIRAPFDGIVTAMNSTVASRPDSKKVAWCVQGLLLTDASLNSLSDLTTPSLWEHRHTLSSNPAQTAPTRSFRV